MSTAIRRSLYVLTAMGLSLLAFQVQAQDREQLRWLETALASNEGAADPQISEVEVKVDRARVRYRNHRHGRDNGVVSIGHDSHLPAGEKASEVVSIFGSSTSEGEVEDAVVSILGSTHVTGSVGDAVVAIMGDVYINSRIGGDAVAVAGSMELGPDAEVEGDVVVIGGILQRAPTAIIHGNVERISAGQKPEFKWLNSWIKNCLLYGRPLAIAPGLEWAWGLALGFLAFYILMALMFRSGVDRCVQTLETQPGRSTLAALLALILTPVAFVILCITIIGIALVPFLWLALMCAGLFGKVVILAALGRRVTRYFGDGPMAHTAVAVLIGGLFVLALYLVPILGFITYKLLGILGLGVVLYTLILAAKSNKNQPPPAGTASAGVAGGAAFVATGEAETGAAPGSQSPPAPEQGQASATSALAAADPRTQPLAGFWVRMGALLIDVILIFIVSMFLGGFDDVGLVALALYGALMWKLRGTTVGGIVCGLQVVRFDGRPIDWATAIVRALGCFVSLVIAGLGFIWIAIDDKKQGWHDKIAGTLVVRAPRGASLV